LRPCVTAIAGNSLLSAVGCEDGSLFLYTPAGRRVRHVPFSSTKKYNPTETSSDRILQMFPCIYLGSGVVHLEANANRHLAAITSDCSIHIWYTCSLLPFSLPPSLFFNTCSRLAVTDICSFLHSQGCYQNGVYLARQRCTALGWKQPGNWYEVQEIAKKECILIICCRTSASSCIRPMCHHTLQLLQLHLGETDGNMDASRR